MKKEEYDLKIKKIKEDFEKDKRKLNIEFSLSNNPHKIGDIIKDNSCTIKIEKIVTSVSYYGYPTCYYVGIKLNKNGEENKLGKKESIHKENIL